MEHFKLLHHKGTGRTLEDVAALFAPVLAPEHPNQAEACQQLLLMLRSHVSPEASGHVSPEASGHVSPEASGHVSPEASGHVSPEASSDAEHTPDASDASKANGTALNESAAYRSLVLSMGTRDSDSDDSDSSLNILGTTKGPPKAIVAAADTTQDVPVVPSLRQRYAAALKYRIIIVALLHIHVALPRRPPTHPAVEKTIPHHALCPLCIFLQPLKRGE